MKVLLVKNYAPLLKEFREQAPTVPLFKQRPFTSMLNRNHINSFIIKRNIFNPTTPLKIKDDFINSTYKLNSNDHYRERERVTERETKSATKSESRLRFRTLSPVTYHLTSFHNDDAIERLSQECNMMPVSLPLTSRNIQMLSPKSSHSKKYTTLNSPTSTVYPSLTISGSSYKRAFGRLLVPQRKKPLAYSNTNNGSKLSPAKSKHLFNFLKERESKHWKFTITPKVASPKIVSSYYSHNYVLAKSGSQCKPVRSNMLSNLLSNRSHRSSQMSKI